MYYQHEFKKIEGTNLIDEEMIEDHLPHAREKFKYLKEKTLKAISDSDNPVLVRYQNVKSFEEAKNISEDIYQKFVQINKYIKVVLVSCLIDNDYCIDDKIFIFKINPSEKWSGDDKSWNRVFDNMSNSVKKFIDYKFWNVAKYEHSNIQGFLNSLTIDGIHSIELSEIPLDILIKNSHAISKGEYIVVSFTAAMLRKGNLAPFFSLSSISEELNLPLISFSDPTMSLSKQITLGWYGGNKYYKNLPILIAQICDEIIEKTGKKLLFVGGSGGGFASLNIQDLMKKFDKTMALVWNPQTDLIAYSKKAVSDYLKVAFGIQVDDSNLKSEIDSKTKNILKHNPNLNRVILMDGYDVRHIRDLKVYFNNILDAEKENNRLLIDKTLICFGDWGRFGDGHSQPPSTLLRDIIFDIYNGVDFNRIDALIKRTNLTHRKLFMWKDKPNLNNVRVSGSFFDDYFIIDTNISDLFFGFELSIRIVERETGKVVYWGANKEYIVNCKEIMKLKNTLLSKSNITAYDVHLSIKDFFGKNHIVVRKFNSFNTKLFGVSDM
ncbi:hypothetical protein ABEF79_15565 [Acinetobacter sp. ANC 7454]|uniref:hypothetical protein n=1 Tax=Acinetobacter thermotolerans TaxID=3151487 RepID=UPI00325B4DD2